MQEQASRLAQAVSVFRLELAPAPAPRAAAVAPRVPPAQPRARAALAHARGKATAGDWEEF
jgi:hypothetical protein